MLKEKEDIFYAARLVANARLHLPNVVSGQPSPLFFEAMCEIVERNIYKGYKTVRGKDVKFSGIKDFMYSFHYGLGIKNMPDFLSQCTEIDVNKKPKDPNLRRFLNWLREEDPRSFQFPPHYWELRRLQLSVYQMPGARDKKTLYANMLHTIYNTHPEILQYIGVNRKYTSIPKAYEAEGYTEKPKHLTPLKLYRNPNMHQIEELARDLNSRLDKLKNRILIAKLIEIYKINEAIEKHFARGASPDDETEI
jgi:hypothetical protein